MSKAYVEEFGSKKATKKQMREFSKRPGKVDAQGNIVYMTEQAHKHECDVNHIVKKYDKHGLISHVSKFEAKFGDLSGTDFKSMYDKVTNAISMFQELPSGIRNRFDNSPAELLRFMDNPDNREEAIDLGIIRGDWTEATDGLGEHVPEGGNVTESENTPAE
jgi:hypothetical protein